MWSCRLINRMASQPCLGRLAPTQAQAQAAPAYCACAGCPAASTLTPLFPPLSPSCPFARIIVFAALCSTEEQAIDRAHRIGRQARRAALPCPALRCAQAAAVPWTCPAATWHAMACPCLFTSAPASLPRPRRQPTHFRPPPCTTHHEQARRARCT